MERKNKSTKSRKVGRRLKSHVSPSNYFRKGYDSKKRFISYWHQINEIISLEPNSVLEIGIGNGLVANYLKRRNYNIKTMDIDERLNPDYVSSVLNIPFASDSFKVVTCFEVLEHLPYEDVSKAIKEVYRVASKYAILSLPDSTRAYWIYIQFPLIGKIKKLISLPQKNPSEHVFDGQHYWEIGKAGYPLRRILTEIKNAGFEVLKTYRIFEVPYYRFFVLAKKKKRMSRKHPTVSEQPYIHCNPDGPTIAKNLKNSKSKIKVTGFAKGGYNEQIVSYWV